MITRFATVVLAGLSVLAAAAEPAAPGSTPVVADQLLDEVVVRGTQLWKMRQNLVKAEEKFYALYNQLNQNDDFDVSCSVEAALGTRLRKRVCRVAFFEEAQAEEAQAFLTGSHAPSALLVMSEREIEYRNAALRVINSDQRLLRLARERESLEKKYREELKRRYGQR